MSVDTIKQINDPEYLQLRFFFDHDGESYECFATVPRLAPAPSKDLICIQLLGLKGDVLITPEEVCVDTLDTFLEEALKRWRYEVSYT